MCAAQEAYFQALTKRHQELQATYLNIWRRLASKIALGKWDENFMFLYARWFFIAQLGSLL